MDGNQRQERRREAVRRLRDGRSAALIAAELGVAINSVYTWGKLARLGGLAALKAKPKTGRPVKLARTHWKRLRRMILDGPARHGFDREPWTLPMVRVLIKREFKVDYHEDHLSRFLRGLGLSVQKPAVRAVERDEKAIKRFVEREFPAIEKKARRQNATLIFEDEAGFLSTPTRATTWGAVGKTPVIRSHGRGWKKVSAIGTLEVSPRVDRSGHRPIRQSFQLYEDNIDGPRLAEYLRSLLRRVRGPVMLLWDGLAAHRSPSVKKVLARFPRLSVHRLPSYAPELNPVEPMWGHGKNVKLRGVAPLDSIDVEVRAAMALSDISTDPRLLRSFFKATPLTIPGVT